MLLTFVLCLIGVILAVIAHYKILAHNEALKKAEEKGQDLPVQTFPVKTIQVIAALLVFSAGVYGLIKTNF